MRITYCREEKIEQLLRAEGIETFLPMRYEFEKTDKNAFKKHLVPSLRMLRFAQGITWVLGEVFLLPEDQMFVTPNEDDGKFLLKEIMTTGNFGKYDSRESHRNNENKMHKFIRRQRRNMRFLNKYTSEVLQRPLFVAHQWIWRKYKGY